MPGSLGKVSIRSQSAKRRGDARHVTTLQHDYKDKTVNEATTLELKEVNYPVGTPKEKLESSVATD